MASVTSETAQNVAPTGDSGSTHPRDQRTMEVSISVWGAHSRRRTVKRLGKAQVCNNGRVLMHVLYDDVMEFHMRCNKIDRSGYYKVAPSGQRNGA